MLKRVYKLKLFSNQRLFQLEISHPSALRKCLIYFNNFSLSFLLVKVSKLHNIPSHPSTQLHFQSLNTTKMHFFKFQKWLTSRKHYVVSSHFVQNVLAVPVVSHIMLRQKRAFQHFNSHAYKSEGSAHHVFHAFMFLTNGLHLSLLPNFVLC